MNAVKKLENLSRRAWLAGMGAYDLGRDKAFQTLDKFQQDSNDFIHQLMQTGQDVEAELSVKINPKGIINEKLQTLKKKFSWPFESTDKKLEELTARVDELIDTVARLTQEKAAAAKPAPKPVAKKAAPAPAPEPVAEPKETTVTKATVAKPVAKKAPAKKPAAKPAASTVAKPATATKTVRKPAVKKPAAPKTSE